MEKETIKVDWEHEIYQQMPALKINHLKLIEKEGCIPSSIPKENLKNAPYKYIGQLYCEFHIPNTEKRVKTEEGEKKFVHEVENMSSTAFLIGGNILLTAAHNLMYYSTLPTNISFFPGQRPPEYNFTEDQNSEEINPNLFFVNEKDIDPESIMIPKEYMDNQHKPIYDYALINLGNQTRSEDQVKKAKSIEEIVGGHLEIKGGEDAIFWNCIGVPGAPIPIQMREERGDNITQILRDEESPRTLFRSGFGMINGTSGGPWMRNGSTSIVNGLHSACNIYADTRHTCSPVFDKKFMDFVEACKQKFNPITSSTNSNSSKI